MLTMQLWILTTTQQSVSKHHLSWCYHVTPNRLLSQRVIQLRQVQLPAVSHLQSGGRKSFSSDVCLESTGGGPVGPPVTALPEEGKRASNSSAPGTEAQQNQKVNSLHSKEEQDKAEQVTDPNGDVTPAADKSKSDAQQVKEKVNTASPTNDNSPLPPFNPHNPVGKIGFFI